MKTERWKKISVGFQMGAMRFPEDTIENRKAILQDVAEALRAYFGKSVSVDSWYDLDKEKQATMKMSFSIEKGLE